MFLRHRKSEIVWKIFILDITALMLSYLIACISKKSFLTYQSINDYLMFFFTTLSVNCWLKPYGNLWVVSIPFKRITLTSFCSYFISYLLLYYRYYLENKYLEFKYLIFGFFISIVLMLTPRFFVLDKNAKKIKESLVIVGYEKNIINYFYFLQSEDYEIEQAIILNYNGPDRKIGNTPITSLEKCKKVEYLALLESTVAEDDFLKLQDLCERYDMRLISFKMKTEYQNLSINQDNKIYNVS